MMGTGYTYSTGPKMTWDQRIAKAKINGEFTIQDMFASGDWPTCQVGELLGKDAVSAVTEDRELYKLGMSFCGAVATHKVTEAEKISNRIKQYLEVPTKVLEKVPQLIAALMLIVLII